MKSSLEEINGWLANGVTQEIIASLESDREKVKTKLETCGADDLPRLQAEVKYIKRILDRVSSAKKVKEFNSEENQE